MEYRSLGSTGVRVSTHCLGAMMFGEWGNKDVDECVRIVHAAFEWPYVGAIIFVFAQNFAAIFIYALVFGTPAKA